MKQPNIFHLKVVFWQNLAIFIIADLFLSIRKSDNDFSCQWRHYNLNNSYLQKKEAAFLV